MNELEARSEGPGVGGGAATLECDDAPDVMEREPVAPNDALSPQGKKKPAWRTDSLAESVAILLVLSVVQRLIGFGRQVLVCRWLAKDQVGEWDVAFRFLMLAAPMAALGLPGSFGRYLEHYRQRGHLKTFLRRTGAVCALLACVATVVIGELRTWVSEQIFASPHRTGMVCVLAVSLVAVIAYNFLTDMLTALRMVRVTSLVQFYSGMIFAVLSVVLVLGWRRDAAAVVVAYAISCAVLFVLTMVWFRRTWRQIEDPPDELPHRQLWSKLVPFAAWLWTVNLLYNLVGVVDRYMLIHFAPSGDPMTLAGDYHSSQVVPMLMVSVCGILGGIIMPHLSHDWETGCKAEVGLKLKLTIKLLALLMVAGAALTLLARPLLFEWALAGKFDGGLQILPWTLTYCIWMALIPVAQMYLWCAERPTLASLAMAVGLVVNVALCWVLLPHGGLHGVAWATAAANLTALTLIYGFNRLHGLQLDWGTCLITLLPAVLGLGTLAAFGALALALLAAVSTNWLFSRDEKSMLHTTWRQYVSGRRRGAVETAEETAEEIVLAAAETHTEL